MNNPSFPSGAKDAAADVKLQAIAKTLGVATTVEAIRPAFDELFVSPDDQVLSTMAFSTLSKSEQRAVREAGCSPVDYIRNREAIQAQKLGAR